MIVESDITRNIDTLVIETTRRCTQMCGHCLRGDAEDCDMSSYVLDSLFEQLNANQIDRIGTITFSGGEPMLNPDVIDQTVDALVRHGISCDSFYIATGAHAIPMEKVKTFICAVARMYAFCDENDLTALNISKDYFHVNDENIERMLKCFSFTSDRDNDKSDSKYFISEGRFDGGSDRKAPMFDLPEDDDYRQYSIYLNVKGDLIQGCDFSYETQDKMAAKQQKFNVIQTEYAVRNYIKYYDGLLKKASKPDKIMRCEPCESDEMHTFDVNSQTYSCSVCGTFQKDDEKVLAI